MIKRTYIFKNGKWIKANKWALFCRTIKKYFTRFKIVDTWKYKLTPHSDSKYIFRLSPKEYEDAKKLYKEKGTVSYEFCPCGGIGWGVKVHILKTGEIVDITDYDSF